MTYDSGSAFLCSFNTNKRNDKKDISQPVPPKYYLGNKNKIKFCYKSCRYCTHWQLPSWHNQTPDSVHWFLQSYKPWFGSGNVPEAPVLTGRGRMCSYNDLIQSSSQICPSSPYRPPRCTPKLSCRRRSWGQTRTEPGTEWIAGKQQAGMLADWVGLRRNVTFSRNC